MNGYIGIPIPFINEWFYYFIWELGKLVRYSLSCLFLRKLTFTHTTYRASLPFNMISGSLDKFSMNRTNNTYWSMIIYVCDLRVIVFILVNTFGAFNPYLLAHCLSCRLSSTSTLRTAITIKMVIGALLKSAMFWTDNYNRRAVVDILHLGIIILIPMHLSGFLDEFFSGQLLAHNLK